VVRFRTWLRLGRSENGATAIHAAPVDGHGESNADAAWTYRDPKPAAAEIKDHVAFWRGVTIES
jgi:uncharacterized protein (DUF427 family)